MFVVDTTDWPKKKSSDSSQQLFISGTLQLWPLKPLVSFPLKWLSDLNGVRPVIGQFRSVGKVCLFCIVRW